MADNLEIPLVYLDGEDLIPTVNKSYVDIGILGLLDKLAFGDPLILKGPKGLGKTLAIEEWCARADVPLVTQSCNSRVNEYHLVGRRSLSGDSISFTCGTITTAIMLANEFECCVLMLDEINTLREDFQTILFSVSDYRRRIEEPSLGRVFKLNKGCSLWVVGTMNPGYAGTYSMSEALISRFNFAEIPFMSPEDETLLLETSFERPPTVSQRRIINKVMTLAKESRAKATPWGYALSTRDLVRFVRNLECKGVTLGLALKLLQSTFPSEFREIIETRVQVIFNINLAKESILCSDPTLK